MKRAIQLSLLALLLSGVAALSSQCQAQRSPTGRSGQPRSGIGRGPSEADKEKARLRIGMTREQQQQIETLYSDADTKAREVFDQIRQKHEQLHALYDAYEIDKNRERTLIREITRLRSQALLIHSETETKVRQILTKEQHEKLRALMKEAMEKFRSRWGQRPAPGGKP